MRHRNKAVTVMVDLTRDANGDLHARLLDAVEGRSGTVYADWLKDEGLEVTVTVEHAALDPFRGYANAIRDELPDAIAVLDAFHVVKLGSTAMDEVRRRVQQETLHRRGHKDDPLYRVRRTLMTGVEHLTDKQQARLEKYLPVGDPNGEVSLAWQAHQRLRAIYHATSPEVGRRLAEQLIDTLQTCPIPEPAARPDPAPVADPDPGLFRHRRGQQRRDRGDQRCHREDQEAGARLQELRELPVTDPARCRRNPALPETSHHA